MKRDERIGLLKVEERNVAVWGLMFMLVKKDDVVRDLGKSSLHPSLWNAADKTR